MKSILLTILLILNFSSLFSQVDSILMTTKQFNKFESIINELDSMLLSDEEVYRQDAQFDSLIEVIDYLEGNKEIEKSKKVLQQAKSIYENSCYISYKENPLGCGCIFRKERSYALKSRLISELEILETAINELDTIISGDELNRFYTASIDNYLSLLERLPKYYNANIESRLWIPRYLEGIKNMRIIIDDKD